MLKFSANLTMLFKEKDFLNRFELAAAAGFKGVEYLFPYEWNQSELAERLHTFRLEQVLFNLPAGKWENGERGIACLPGRKTEFQEGVGKALEYAKALKCKRMNCLVGIIPQYAVLSKIRETLIENLKFAAVTFEKEDIRLLVEAVNRRDVPNYYLVNTPEVLQVFNEVKQKNLWLQYDVYHMQVMEGNLTETITNNINRIAHVQIADNPGRHEPGTGEINFDNLLNFIDKTGYDGWIGCEYNPTTNTRDSLKWMKKFNKEGS
jgi:hydroxypyruvate isomerase